MADILGWLSGIKELVSTWETRSIAETTAGNTRSQNLIDAINGLELGGGTTVVEAPNVNVYPKIIVNCGCGGSGQPPQTVGEEGGTPPEGSTYPSEIDSRKCKAATIIVDDIIAYTNGLEGMGLFNWSLDFTSLSTAARSIIVGSTLLLGNIWSNVTGLFEQLAIAIWDSEVSPGSGDAIQAKREDLICALYNAQNVTGARDNALTASGLTGGPAAWLNRLLVNDALNLLFFASGDSESIIGAYAGSVDCGGCAGISYSYLSQGTCPELGTGNRAIPVDGEWRTFYAENFGYWGFAVDDNFIGDVTPTARWNVQIEFRNLVGFTITHPAHGFRAGHNNVNNSDIYMAQNFASLQAALATTCAGTIGFTAGASYSVEMRLSECSQ